MNRPPGQPIAAFILAFLFAGLYLLYLTSSVWLIIHMHTGPHPLVMTATQDLPQSDFARLWAAGKAMPLQPAGHFGTITPTSPWFRSTFQLNMLSANKNPALVWLYPPTMTLLGSLFSLLPLAPSFWLWNIATLAIAAICLRKSGLSWPIIAAGLASPAEIHNFMGGQNGALTAGFFAAALMSFDGQPIFAGAMAGLLCIKPQIALALPMILLRPRYLKTLLSCFAAAAFMILLSMFIEGWSAWVWFITVAEPKTTLILNAPMAKLMPGGFTVLMMARSFHASLAQAWTLQAASTAASALLIWRRWQRPNDDPVSRMAFTLCLSVLITPYGYIYDLVGFSIGMAAMFAQSSPRQKPVYALLWLMSGYYSTLWNLTGIILMPIAAAFGAWMTLASRNPARHDPSIASPIALKPWSHRSLS